MAKQLKFSYQDKEYTLEFTRKTVAEMERKGAFLAHHKYVKPEIINEIFDKMTNKEDLIGKLAEMYAEPILSLIEEPEEAEGNLKWTASF